MQVELQLNGPCARRPVAGVLAALLNPTVMTTTAAGPRIPATAAGSTKIPDPTIVFTMYAASARTPSARTRVGPSGGAPGDPTGGARMRQYLLSREAFATAPRYTVISRLQGEGVAAERDVAGSEVEGFGSSLDRYAKCAEPVMQVLE